MAIIDCFCCFASCAEWVLLCVVLFLSHFRPVYRRQTHASLWKTRKKRRVFCCNIHRMTCRYWSIGSVDRLIGFVLHVFVFSSLRSQADCSIVYLTRSLRGTLAFVEKTNRQQELLLSRAIIIDLRVGRIVAFGPFWQNVRFSSTEIIFFYSLFIFIPDSVRICAYEPVN
jgi:hypothetical protein